MYTASGSLLDAISTDGFGRGRRYNGARRRRTSNRVSPPKYSVRIEPVIRVPRPELVLEDEFGTDATRASEPVEDNRAEDGTLAHASAQRNTAG